MVGKWTDIPPRPSQPKQKDCLLTQMLAEQRKTNELLLMLIEALGNEQVDIDMVVPDVYLSGSPVLSGMMPKPNGR